MDNTPYDDVFRTLLTDCTELKQLEAEYASIRERLEIACQMGDLNRYAKAAILDMSRKVIEQIADVTEKSKEEVEAVLQKQK